MKKESLQSELFRNGLIEKGDKDAIQKFKQERTKRKSKEYNEAYLKDKKSKSLVFSKKQYEEIQRLSKEYDMPEASFLKACIQGYIHSTYIPLDKEVATNISNLLLDIKNAVLQSLQYVHMNDNLNYSDIQAITEQITDLEFFLTNAIENPPELSVWLSKQTEKNNQFISILLKAISEFILSHQCQ